MKTPKIKEIADYCAEKGIKIDVEAFYDHHEMVGWVYGKHRTPIKSWRAAVRTWERNAKRWEQEREQRPRRGNGSAGRPQSFEAMVENLGAQLGVQSKPGESYRDWYIRLQGAQRRAH